MGIMWRSMIGSALGMLVASFIVSTVKVYVARWRKAREVAQLRIALVNFDKAMAQARASMSVNDDNCPCPACTERRRDKEKAKGAN